MKISVKHESSFVGYEYTEVTVGRPLEHLYRDCYENFGWEYEGYALSLSSPLSPTMKFKRDRKLHGKAELTRLQRQFDACAADLAALEKSKTLSAATAAYIIGLVGTVFMVGSVFAVTSGLISLCILLVIPAFLGWVLPYPVFRWMQRKKTAKVTPLIDAKYEEIYTVCEKAHDLLG